MTVYAIASKENYDPTFAAYLANVGYPAVSFGDQSFFGSCYDRVLRQLTYTVGWTVNASGTNTTGFTLWTGNQSFSPSASMNFEQYFTHYVMRKSIDTETVVSYFTNPSSAMVPSGAGPVARGYVVFSGNPTNGTNIVLNGVTWGFVTSGASGTNTNIQLTLAETLTQLAADLTASANGSIDVAYYSGLSTRSDGPMLYIFYKTAGTGGNAYTLNAGTAASSVSAGTLAGGAMGSDGSWLRATDMAETTNNIPKIIDPLTGNLWQHAEMSGSGTPPFDCGMYLFRLSDSYAQILSPRVPFDWTDRHLQPIGISANWMYDIEWPNGGSAGTGNYLVGTPQSISAAETAADRLIPYFWIAMPQDPTLWAYGVAFSTANILYFFMVVLSGARNYKLYRFNEPSAATPWNNGTVSGGFTDITPWSSSTGPNTNATNYTTDGSFEGNEKTLIFYLPDTNVLVTIAKFFPADGTALTQSDLFFDCTYVTSPDSTASFDYHSAFLTGFVTAAFGPLSSTGNTIPAGAAWAIIDCQEIDPYINLSSYEYVDAAMDYTKRWFLFTVQPVASGTFTPDSSLYEVVHVQYHFVEGSAPAVVQTYAEAGWDAALLANSDYTGFVDAPQLKNLISTVGEAPFNFYDNGVFDPTTNAFWWSGQQFNNWFVANFFLNRENNSDEQNPSPPFLKLSFGPITPLGKGKVYSRMIKKKKPPPITHKSAVGSAHGKGGAAAFANHGVRAVGTVTGMGVASAQAGRTATAVGSAAGAGAASAITGGAITAVGTSAGAGIASAISGGVITAVGTAAGQGAADGVSSILGLLTTMTLVNTSGSTQAANFITPVFGHSFRKGDISAKAVFTGSISGTTLTTSGATGTIGIGDLIFAGSSAVAPWTYITGGSGTSWTVSVSQTVSSTTMWSAGTPQFIIGGTAQPLTWGCQNFWSDHSLKHASFAFRCGSSIAGNGTLNVTVNSGGTTPTTSTRPLTDVYNQSLQVNIAGVIGLSGTWTGTLASNALNIQQAVYLDGAAGKWWRIHTNAGQSGVAHGQIEVYHYIGALTANGDGLGGFRYVPRIAQPWYNVNSPALTPYAANLSWQYGGGPTTVNWTWPFQTINFTTAASSNICTVAGGGTHNYYQGAIEGNNAVPGIFTVSGGALDTAITAGTIYWVINVNALAADTQFQVFTAPGYAGTTPAGLVTMNGNATGTMTFTPTPHILPLQSIFDLANDGQPKFFQGTGSISADNTVMTQFNCAYLVSTGLIQPFDTSYTGTAFSGTVEDNAAVLPAGWNYNWTPTTTGPIGLSGIGTAGEHDYLGPVTQYAARHFYNQTVLDAKIVRQMATCSDFFGVSSFRDSVSGNYANLSANAYTGLPGAGMSGRIENISGFLQLPVGITNPPAATMYFNVGEPNGAHKPSMAFWAGLVFAEPHFVDLTVEMGIGSITNFGIGVRNYSSPMPAGTGIVSNVGNGGMRECAWQLRDIIHGAIVAPNTHPDGSQSCDMLRDYANNNLNYQYSLCTSTLAGSYFYGIGRYNPMFLGVNSGAPEFDDSALSFSAGYMLNVIPMGVGGLENAGALNVLKYWANGWQHYLNTFSGYYLTAEDDFAVFLDSGGNALGPIPSDSYWGVPFAAFGATFLYWANTSSPYFSVDAWSGVSGLKNGDMLMFDGSGQPVPTNFSAQVPYYIRDLSGITFNLAATVGGVTITPGNSGHQQGQAGAGGGNSGPYGMMILPSWGVATTGNVAAGGNAYNSYCQVKWSGWNFCNAVGATGCSQIGSTGYSLISDAFERMTVNGNTANFPNGPAYLTASTLP